MIRALLHRPRQGFSRQVDLAELSDVLAEKHAVLWLDVQDPSPEDLELLRREFGFHELALEDVALPHQRPKLEEYDHFYFMVFYSLQLQDMDGGLLVNELDLFVGQNYLVAVHRAPMREIGEAQRRWERNQPLLGHGVGGLVHALLDTLVDGYFEVSDALAERVAEVEERIIRDPDQGTLQSLFAYKKQLLALRRILGPERDALGALMRQDIPLLDKRTLVYLRDVHDHLIRITDTVDLQSDLLTSAMDVYMSSASNRLNQVVKTLTGVTIILMSMALVSGIYGMNFRNMPELGWELGYAWALGLMAALGVGLYLILKRVGWL